MFWGGNFWLKDYISGNINNIDYNYKELDELSQMLKDNDMAGYWSYCYNPPPLQDQRNDWRTAPKDMVKWGELLSNITSHLKEKDLRAEYNSIWNEPDFKDFYIDSMSTFFEMYKYGSLGIKKGDKDAYVGGPDLAFDASWIEPFLQYIEDNKLPLDFFSYHALGANVSTRTKPCLLIEIK